MITLEHVAELKGKLSFLKDHLHHSLHEVISIDMRELGDKTSLSFEEGARIRKKLSRLKPIISHQFNSLLFFLDQQLIKQDPPREI